MKNLCVVFLLLIQTLSFAQSVTSKVLDKESGSAIPFASIGIIGTSKGTSTNLNGEFNLTLTNGQDIKISCVGYESIVVNASKITDTIYLQSIATELNEVIVLAKNIHVKNIVRKAFARISDNFNQRSFQQNYFYRHYCKDDASYGRLIEASFDVLKHDGYRSYRKTAGEHEEIRINQLRRSLDNTLMAQGHEPIAINNILQADIAGYQQPDESLFLKFYVEANDMKINMNNYIFHLDGITRFDREEVYQISFTYKEDSILTTSGYVPAPASSGSLYITRDNYAIVKFEETRKDKIQSLKTQVYYKKHGGYYYPYHLLREGENTLPGNHHHYFHIELIGVDINEAPVMFTGKLPGREDLFKVPYDSSFWSRNTILKTTPLEDKILNDLGGGQSLNQQFLRYKTYEWSSTNGGVDGEQKIKWLISNTTNKNFLLCFWNRNDQNPSLYFQYLKILNQKYQQKLTIVIIFVDTDQAIWNTLLNKYTLFTDGIINYRLDPKSNFLKQFGEATIPLTTIITTNGKQIQINPNDASALQTKLNDLLN